MIVQTQCFDLTLEVSGDFEPPQKSSLYDPGAGAEFEIDSIWYCGERQKSLEHSDELRLEIAAAACEAAENEWRRGRRVQCED
jgi:hypothetical protein